MNTIVNDGIELTREERKQRFIDNYRLNLAPDTSIRKTIKSGRELLEFAKQHAEKKDYHFKNGGYVPTQGLMLKQDIEDVICYYIEDAKCDVPLRVVNDYEWLLDRLDENDMFHSKDENEINKFRRLYDRYHTTPRMPGKFKDQWNAVKITYYNASRFGKDFNEVKDQYYKNNY